VNLLFREGKVFRAALENRPNAIGLLQTEVQAKQNLRSKSRFDLRSQYRLARQLTTFRGQEGTAVGASNAMQEGDLYHDLKHYSRADLDLLRTSMRDVADRYPNNWNYNNFAWISCRNEMFAEAKAYLDKITDSPTYPPWPTPAIFEACKDMARRTAPSV